MRKFTTGGIRDDDEMKLDFEGFISPIVLERFAEYMHKHRFLKDGSVRKSDNWQNLFGDDHYNVCMKSAWRHFFSWWKAHRGYTTEEDIEESMMGLLFNLQAYLFKRLNEKNNNKTIKEK